MRLSRLKVGDLAAVSPEQIHDQLDGSSLAGSVGTDKPHHITSGESQRDLSQLEIGEALC